MEDTAGQRLAYHATTGGVLAVNNHGGRLALHVSAEDKAMTVFLLIREDQNEHGYIDTSITGVFREASIAREIETLERLHARQEGLVVEDDESPDGEWQVSWKVEEHLVD
jgi:hypothetical protein